MTGVPMTSATRKYSLAPVPKCATPFNTTTSLYRPEVRDPGVFVINGSLTHANNKSSVKILLIIIIKANDR